MQDLSFFTRLWMALVCFFQILFKPSFARQVWPAYQALRGLPAGPAEEKPGNGAAKPPETPPERLHASGLFVLSMLQREGRLIDFLQEDVAAFSDAEVGAAARIVHEGCRKVLRDYLVLEPVLKDPEGARVTVGPQFDAQRIRLTGNVAGQPPFSGALKHHGWVTRSIRLPPPPDALDPTVLAPAEVELS